MTGPIPTPEDVSAAAPAEAYVRRTRVEQRGTITDPAGGKLTVTFKVASRGDLADWVRDKSPAVEKLHPNDSGYSWSDAEYAASRVVSWNYHDEDGLPIPVSGEAVRTLSKSVFESLVDLVTGRAPISGN